MIAPARSPPTQPGRCDQQNLADGAHEGPSGPEELPLARRARTEAHLCARGNAGSHARQRRRCQPRARPQRRSTESGVAPDRLVRALELPENALRWARTAAFSLSGGRRAAPSWTRLPCRPTASARRHRPPACLQYTERGGSVFVAPRALQVPGARFGVGQFWETEQPRDSETERRTETEHAGAFSSVSKCGSQARRGLSRRALDRPEQLVVRRVRVDAGRHHRLGAANFCVTEVPRCR